jgi:hypothetical protein
MRQGYCIVADKPKEPPFIITAKTFEYIYIEKFVQSVIKDPPKQEKLVFFSIDDLVERYKEEVNSCVENYIDCFKHNLIGTNIVPSFVEMDKLYNEFNFGDRIQHELIGPERYVLTSDVIFLSYQYSDKTRSIIFNVTEEAQGNNWPIWTVRTDALRRR